MKLPELLQKPKIVIPLMILLLAGLIYGIKQMDAKNAHPPADGSTHTH